MAMSRDEASMTFLRMGMKSGTTGDGVCSVGNVSAKKGNSVIAMVDGRRTSRSKAVEALTALDAPDPSFWTTRIAPFVVSDHR